VSTVELSITNRLGDLARVTRSLHKLAASDQVPPGIAGDMHVALDEVLTNVIKHAYADHEVHRIHVRLRVAHGALEAEVEDDGAPFDPLTLPSPPRRASLAAPSAGGLGFHFVRHLMTEVRYARIENRNRLVLRKVIGSPPEEEPRGPQ
jgi:serine/threonine-protein kinase RsbW